MAWLLIVILILVGLLFIVLEILVIPGVVVGVLGVSLMVVGIYESFINYGITAGYFTILGTLLFSIILAIIIFRSKTWNKLMLHDQNTAKVNVIEENKVKVGDRGKASSKLSVIGKAHINGEYYEVQSIGDYIDSGSEIEVVKIDSNKIFVKKINQ